MSYQEDIDYKLAFQTQEQIIDETSEFTEFSRLSIEGFLKYIRDFPSGQWCLVIKDKNVYLYRFILSNPAKYQKIEVQNFILFTNFVASSDRVAIYSYDLGEIRYFKLEGQCITSSKFKISDGEMVDFDQNQELYIFTKDRELFLLNIETGQRHYLLTFDGQPLRIKFYNHYLILSLLSDKAIFYIQIYDINTWHEQIIYKNYKTTFLTFDVFYPNLLLIKPTQEQEYKIYHLEEQIFIANKNCCQINNNPQKLQLLASSQYFIYPYIFLGTEWHLIKLSARICYLHHYNRCLLTIKDTETGQDFCWYYY